MSTLHAQTIQIVLNVSRDLPIISAADHVDLVVMAVVRTFLCLLLCLGEGMLSTKIKSET